MSIENTHIKVGESRRSISGRFIQEKKTNTNASLIYDHLLNKGLIAYFLLNQKGEIIDVNDCFCEALNYKSEELKSRSFFDLLCNQNEADKLAQHLHLASTSNDVVHLNLTFKNKNSLPVHGLVKGFCYRPNYQEEHNQYYFLFDDITNKIKVEEKLKAQTQNFKLRDELLITRDFELKKQNNELQRLNKELESQLKNNDELQSRIITSELRFRLAFNYVNDGVWDWDLAKGEIFFSDRFFLMLGYDAFELPGTVKTWESLILPEDRSVFKQLIEQLENGTLIEFSTEYRMLSKSGKSIWILSRGRQVEKDVSGVPLRAIGTHVDITEFKEIQFSLKLNTEKLEKQNEEYAKLNKKLVENHKKTVKINQHLKDKQTYLNSIYKTVPASISLVSDRIFLFTNEYTSLLTGYELDELIGHDSLFLYPSDEEYNRVCKNLFENNTSGNTKSVNTCWKTKNGTLLDIYLTATAIPFEVPAQSFTITAIDVTSQRIYEEELIEAKDKAEKAEKLKTVFLANMSHELRTPMNGIVGFAEMLQTQVNQAKREQYLKIIVNSSKQLLKIISDIMDISKIESGEVETFFTTICLNNLLKELYDYYLVYLSSRNKEKITLQYSCCFEQGSDNIITDETKLKRVLNSLIGNAVKFTDEGVIKFGYEVKNNLLEFYVSDTGIGIEESEKQIIFEAFRQTESPIRKKYGGNGLGLAISKGMLQSLDGEIWVESEIEKGSTFYFTIPLKFEEQLAWDEMNTENNEQNKAWVSNHILVVEDDLTCFSLIEEMLEETGVKVTHAITGLEAVKLCRKDNSFDLVLMDMRLPEMDGYEATRRIKEFKPNLTVIAQTAHALSEDRNKCMAAGCDEYLTKPVNQNILIQTIARYLKQNQ